MRKYVAKISQAGTSDPVASVMLNTLCGTPVWTRQETGRYLCTPTGAFPAGKTVVTTPHMDDWQESVRTGDLIDGILASAYFKITVKVP